MEVKVILASYFQVFCPVDITFQQFKKELEPKLRAKGWWGKKLVGYGEGGKVVQLGSTRRLATIYQTNLQTAYMTGRYKALMENIEDRPYFQYVAILDAKTRPAHRSLNGKVFRWDDPFWKAFWPPNGWNCRCDVRALSADDMKNRNLEVSQGEGNLHSEEQLVSMKTGRKEPVTVYTDPKTKMEVATDVGWNYNPGESWTKPFTAMPYDPTAPGGGFKIIGASAMNKAAIESLPAKPFTKDMLLPAYDKSGWSEADYVNRFLKEFGADMDNPVVYRDIMNDSIVISKDLFVDRTTGKLKIVKNEREKYLLLLADTIKDPVELWLTWVKGQNKTRLCKRYIGLYQGDKKRLGGYVVFDLIDDAWQGTTAFQPGDMKYLDKQRAGTLIYTKK